MDPDVSAGALSPPRWSRRELEDIIAQNSGRLGPLLPVLHDVQAAFGCIPAGAVPIIAEMLNLSRAEIHGVITFYDDFRTSPPGKPVIKLCRAEACQARGVDRIAPILEADGRIEVETVYCLGLCASGPAAMAGREVFARIDERNARQLADRLAAR